MRNRLFWVQKIEALWQDRPIVWLSGVRRIGKTTLAKQITGATYFNCELPSVQQQLSDPEFFFANRRGMNRLIFDEVHHLADPSITLKIAADEFPHLRILATGSSTLAATHKFKDTLTGRKHHLYLSPVLWSEASDWGCSLEVRLKRGGFPDLLLKQSEDPLFFEEWIDSFYARDILALFGVRDRGGFLKLLTLLFLKSGSMVDAASLAQESGLSRPTVLRHLEALEVTHAICSLPPFFGGGTHEIVKRPKLYGFDTGMVCHINGWQEVHLREQGILWEHLVLDGLRTHFPKRHLHYWRTKGHDEIDFVVAHNRQQVDIIEAKISPQNLSSKAIRNFRSCYPKGNNYVVCPNIKKPYLIKAGDHALTVCDLDYFNTL
jgi:predicted AAA+ superfamily ATPase